MFISCNEPEVRKFKGALSRARTALRAFGKSDGELGWARMSDPLWAKYSRAYQRAQYWSRFCDGDSELSALYGLMQTTVAERDTRIMRERDAEMARLTAKILADKRAWESDRGW